MCHGREGLPLPTSGRPSYLPLAHHPDQFFAIASRPCRGFFYAWVFARASYAVAMIDEAFFIELSRTARRAIDAAKATTLVVESKSHAVLDPVTNVDRAVERALREQIERRFPEDGIAGEEYGSVRNKARRRWSIDPIDGTRAFICDLPSWSVLVGLRADGEHVAGMIDIPALGELYVAANGCTTRNGVLALASGCTELTAARVSTTDPFLFEGAEFEAFDRVRSLAAVARYGLDGAAYARLASGGLDLVIESGLRPHDYGALIPSSAARAGISAIGRGARTSQGAGSSPPRRTNSMRPR